jgi:hypothetical protein
MYQLWYGFNFIFSAVDKALSDSTHVTQVEYVMELRRGWKHLYLGGSPQFAG